MFADHLSVDLSPQADDPQTAHLHIWFNSVTSVSWRHMETRNLQ